MTGWRMSPSKRTPRDEIRRELDTHLALEIEELVASGMTRADAERAARRAFGDRVAAERRLVALARRVQLTRWMREIVASFGRDVIVAGRGLLRQPGFTVIAIVTLGVGIGATTAIFSVVNGVLLTPLNYHEPDRLVTLWSVPPEGSGRTSPSFPDFEDWRDQSTTFTAMAFLRGAGMTWLASNGAEQFTVGFVTTGFVETSGARAHLGSLTALREENPPESVVVLKYDTWRSRFGGDRAVVGRTLEFTEGTFRVAAVLESGEDYPLWAEMLTVLTPALVRAEGLAVRDYRLDNRVVARLAPGATLDEATAELQTIAARLSDVYPASNENWRVEGLPLTELLVGDVRTSLWILFAAVGAVLIIACTNVANLCLARTLARGREMGVRASLGASRVRIVRHLLTESVLLAGLGGVVGVLLARWGVAAFLAWGVPGLPRASAIAVDHRVLLFAGFTSVLAALFFGLAPAAYGSRVNLTAALKHAVGDRQPERLRTALVVGQIAITVVLLAATGLLAKSFTTLQRVSPGFSPEGLVVLRLNLPAEYEGRPDARLALYERLVEAARIHPAVEASSIVNHLPLAGTGVISPLRVDGFAEDVRLNAWLRIAGPEYFTVIGLPVVAGRSFTREDHRARSGAVLISETFARQLFGEQDPVGRRITVFRQASVDPDYGAPIHGEIVGVVADTRRTMRTLEATPAVYIPHEVHPWPSAYLVVRSRANDPGAADALRAAVTGVDPRIPVTGVTPLEELAQFAVGRDRFLTVLSGVFSSVAAILALVGVYGMLSYTVRRRTRDVGIRIALGATRVRVTRAVLGRAAAVVGVGIALGFVGTVAVSRFLEAVLFDTSPVDPPVLTTVVLSMAALGMVGAWLPAQRAGRTDPMRVLREE